METDDKESRELCKAAQCQRGHPERRTTNTPRLQPPPRPDYRALCPLTGDEGRIETAAEASQSVFLCTDDSLMLQLSL